ncbi:hypothetical protein D9757_005064 [Collybiopsis confluens]|uniref:DUF7918 domain-containing protein n=1 Tax=Collybiopsis confluens TaxID=2823264 RepID=A0A8H5HT12_9AGAR|nr:hypothetical protein D9757_005064 [Collybiopsis confluens]
MLHAGPYSTWIVVDGTRLDTHSPIVYHNSRTNSSRVSGWITSEAGKKFSLSWHNATRGVALEAVVWIDGVECSRHVMLPACDFPDRPDTVRVSNTRTSEINRRDFLFSAVQVTDSDEYASSAGNVGAITLDLWRLHINRVVHRPLLHRLNGSSTMLEPQIVHERSKMDGMHHVRLGEEYSTPLPMVDMVDGERMDSDPYVSFTFNYRPRAPSSDKAADQSTAPTDSSRFNTSSDVNKPPH